MRELHERAEPSGTAPGGAVDADTARASVAVSGWRMAAARATRHLTRPAEMLLNLGVLLREALPIGLLHRHEIEQLVWESYRNEPDFYDARRPSLRFEDELLPLLERHARGRDLLDLYCGHGREAEIFARAGYHVTGVDAQPESVEAARGHARGQGFEARFVEGDIDVWEPPRRDWDVVYTSLWMYSTVPDRASRLTWLRRLGGWIAADGVMIVSVTPRTSSRGPALRHALARTVAAMTFNGRTPELGDRFRTELFWHDFTTEEVRAELAAAELELLDSHAVEGNTPCVFHVVRAAPATPER